jgi:hypothetical protein
MHLIFVAHVRGSAIRIGPDQFPELHARIHEIARRIGMKKVPDAYLMQGDGGLNAFATRFARSHMIILLSDLLEACGDNEAARDMIIGHELGHIHAGHLRWRWLTLPASIVPFLGSALSRAREYTCDRYGVLAAGNQDGALLGLTILAAGAKHARAVNRASFVAQRSDLNTGWMRIGEWLSSHPPLSRRIVALDPRFGRVSDGSGAGTARALGILGAASVAMLVLVAVGISKLPSLLEGLDADGAVAEHGDGYTPPEFELALAQLDEAFARVSMFIAEELRQGRPFPADMRELEARWRESYPDEELPRDPFDGYHVGYNRTPDGYLLWSVGADQQPYTHDDIVYRFDGS